MATEEAMSEYKLQYNYSWDFSNWSPSSSMVTSRRGGRRSSWRPSWRRARPGRGRAAGGKGTGRQCRWDFVLEHHIVRFSISVWSCWREHHSARFSMQMWMAFHAWILSILPFLFNQVFSYTYVTMTIWAGSSDGCKIKPEVDTVEWCLSKLCLMRLFWSVAVLVSLLY